MTTPRNTPAWQTPTGFAVTHCKKCKYGWTRTGKEGALTVCLLDHAAPVLGDMTNCDKYKLEQQL